MNDAPLSCRFVPSTPWQPISYGLQNTRNFTVLGADLNVTGTYGGYAGMQGPNEEEPGVFMPINDDFDEDKKDAANANAPIADNLAPDKIVETDDELRDASISLWPVGLQGKWKLVIPPHLKVWRKVNNVWTVVISDLYSPLVTVTAPDYRLNIDLKVEGISLAGGAPNLKLIFLPVGANSVIEDKVTVNVAKLDLDVTNNGSIDDLEDKAINYLPGYSGDTRKLSTGTTFNAPGYVGQQMQLLLKGVGTEFTGYTGGTAVTSVEFQLSSVSEHNGFCENGFDTKVGWNGQTVDANGNPQIDQSKNDDFSFDELTDTFNRANPSQPVLRNGTLAAGQTTRALWCKDYGGRAVLKVEVRAGLLSVGTFNLTLPLDNENNGIGDGIADKWEKEKVKEWNTQFGKTETVDNAFFNNGDDKELIDPDDVRTDAARLTFSRTIPTNTPATQNDAMTMGAHSLTGDTRTALQEYRGFLLDGGGFDWAGSKQFNAFGIVNSGTTGAVIFNGGHIRLNPAHKEFLVAVNAMTGVTNMPTQVGIQGWMDTISQNMSKRQDGAGLRMFYVLHDLATPYNLFPNASNVNHQTIIDYLNSRVNPTTTPTYRPLTTFEHLQLADEFSTLGTAGIAFPRAIVPTGGVGAIYAVDKGEIAIARYYSIPSNPLSTSYIAHELHHANVNTNAHYSDTNDNALSGEADDKIRVLWNSGFLYSTQQKNLPNGVVANATELVLNNTDLLTATGWVVVNRNPNVDGSGTVVKYTSISGNRLTGCLQLDLTNINPNTNQPTSSPLTAFPPGTFVEPRFSAEDYKQIKYGAGTTKLINQLTP